MSTPEHPGVQPGQLELLPASLPRDLGMERLGPCPTCPETGPVQEIAIGEAGTSSGEIVTLAEFSRRHDEHPGFDPAA